MPTAVKHIHTHATDCPDRKAAAADRKEHDAAAKERELRQQVIAKTKWYGGDL